MTGALAINEMFATIQGEGFFAGTPAVFIRLQGCPVGCPWCDTKHTWPISPMKQVPWEATLSKVKEAPTWSLIDTEALVHAVETTFTQKHFVITGGEPCAQNIFELTVQLLRLGQVQIETSGTHDIDVALDCWVTVSPKIEMPGGLDVLAAAIARANEIKMPVGSGEDIDRLKKLVPPEHLSKVCLQPISQDPDATALCIEQCLVNNWRLSLQTHKYAAVR